LEKKRLKRHILKNFSFFYHNRRKHGSGKIRGRQVADRMDAKKNPIDGYQEDICIYVKMRPEELCPEKTYYDIIDAMTATKWLKESPEIGVITMTKIGRDYLFKNLNRKNIHIIPQHHCNYEKIQRPQRKVKVVGYIGGARQLQYNPVQLEKELADVGLEFKYRTKFLRREDVTSFLKTIDINIAFRCRPHRKYLKDALKLINAGSFGIPSVAYPEMGYEATFRNRYIKVKTKKDLIAKCKQLATDRDLYSQVAHDAWTMANTYHIDNIIPLYQQLN
jgi:hypothetical protein